MILLATILSFGWPTLRTEFGPPVQPAPGWVEVRAGTCCGSMRPHIRGGERMYVTLPQAGERLIGQLVATPYALHMVTAETRTHVRTAGTANRESDGWTAKKDVLYVVRYVIRP